MLRPSNLDKQELDLIDPFGKYLANIACVIWCMYHTLLEAMLGQFLCYKLYNNEHRQQCAIYQQRPSKTAGRDSVALS
eukprot:14060633-Ditylum_brightwellii.AAC.1